MEGQEDLATYDAVVNDEEQHSIWRAHKEPPLGWRRTCLARVSRLRMTAGEVSLCQTGE